MPVLKIPKFDDFDLLLNHKIGYFENIFFADAVDWSKVLFFFNGAVTKEKIDLDLDSAIFQRWSWHSKFRHPIFCIADPLTYGEGSIPLGWYHVDRDHNFLKNMISTIQSKLVNKGGNFKTLAFGSSGGGYAALLCVQLGLIDSAIVVNPQTDIMRFWEKNALNSFLDKRKMLGFDSNSANYSLLNTGFAHVKKKCEIVYVQNICDESHYLDHMLPYVDALLGSKGIDKFNLVCFNNPGLGHNPPDILSLSEILGSSFTSLLK